MARRAFPPAVGPAMIGIGAGRSVMDFLSQTGANPAMAALGRQGEGSSGRAADGRNSIAAEGSGPWFSRRASSRHRLAERLSRGLQGGVTNRGRFLLTKVVHACYLRGPQNAVSPCGCGLCGSCSFLTPWSQISVRRTSRGPAAGRALAFFWCEAAARTARREHAASRDVTASEVGPASRKDPPQAPPRALVERMDAWRNDDTT